MTDGRTTRRTRWGSIFTTPSATSSRSIATRRSPASTPCRSSRGRSRLSLPASAQWDGPQQGRFLLQDVYRGLTGIPRGSVKRLRIVGVPPKVQPNMNSPMLGVSAEDPGKFVLGTVPVEADGSAHFRVPSGVPVFFQAFDAEGAGHANHADR